VSFLPERAEIYSTALGETFATTGVAPLLVAPCFKRPLSFVVGDAGVPVREDLT